MDRSQFRNRILMKIAATPSVLLPIVLGTTVTIGSWALGHASGLMSFLGISGILAGLGVLATKWLYGFDKAVAELTEEEARSLRARQQGKLDDLDARLCRDEDPRSEEMLRRLRQILEQFQRDMTENRGGMGRAQLAEIGEKSNRLFVSCVASLERSLLLSEAALKMHTEDAKQRMLAARENLLEQVAISTEHLARIADSVRALSLTAGGEQSMEKIRRELDESMSVARRVDERMRSIRESLEGDEDWMREGGRWE